MPYDDVPKYVKDFLLYLGVVNGKSRRTVYEYYLDLRSYLRFVYRMKCSIKGELDEIDITQVDLDFFKQITLQDTYEYLYYLKTERNCNNCTVNRKCCSIRMFFKYMCNKVSLLDHNPMENLESSSLPKTLPKYLSLEESKELLKSSGTGANPKRDYAIILLFLSCGMRLSELVAINISDLDHDFLTITGKGNKQRSIYLSQPCKDAVDDYMQNERRHDHLKDDAKNALFVSRNGNRISRRMVQNIVEKHLKESGLGDKHYSTHKLRHTAATLMHKYGNIDIRVLQELLGHENLGTTQIYTHVDNDQIKLAVNANPISKLNKEKTDN